ncbi:hypothetical protein [Haloarchaeobius sp. DFWS5]|uniref:hypothetical protein n=1 Tax=Haloarchaeobius sp. DFWS5 TaxID=3446114 RepID=UPI003EB8D052
MNWEQLKYWWTNSEVVYVDEPLERRFGFGMLRSLPAVNRINLVVQQGNVNEGADTSSTGLFTYPKQWRQLGNVEQFGMEPHEWRLLDEIEPASRPVGIFTNTWYEQKLPYSIGQLVSKCRRSGRPVYVFADDREFQIDSATRPLREEHYTFSVEGGYPVVYDALKEYYQSQGIRFPLSDTRNIFLQDNAFLFNEIQSRKSVSSAQELFDVVSEAPYLPLYGSLIQIFNRNDSKGSDAIPSEELDAFRKWLMRRINWSSSISRDVAESLNERVLADANVFAAPTRVNHPTKIDVDEYLPKLTDGSSPLHYLYARWLNEGTQI